MMTQQFVCYTTTNMEAKCEIWNQFCFMWRELFSYKTVYIKITRKNNKKTIWSHNICGYLNNFSRYFNHTWFTNTWMYCQWKTHTAIAVPYIFLWYWSWIKYHYIQHVVLNYIHQGYWRKLYNFHIMCYFNAISTSRLMNPLSAHRTL